MEIDVECPYCTMMSLEPLPDGERLIILAADGGIAPEELDIANWRAYMCATCTRVVILDDDAITN